MSRAVPVKVGVHLVFEGWGFAFSLACRNGGSMSWVVEQAGGRERLSFCGGVPVPGNGRRGRGRWQRGGRYRCTWRHSGCFGQWDVGRGSVC